MTLVLAWAIFKSILKAYQLTQHIGWHEKWWQIGHGGASDWNAVQQQQQRQLWSIQIVRCHSIHVSFVPRCIQSVALAKRLLFLSNFLVLFRVCRRRRHCRHCTADLFRTNGPRLLLDRGLLTECGTRLLLEVLFCLFVRSSSCNFQRSAKVLVHGLVKYVPGSSARAGTNFTKPRTKTLADLYICCLAALQLHHSPSAGEIPKKTFIETLETI